MSTNEVHALHKWNCYWPGKMAPWLKVRAATLDELSSTPGTSRRVRRGRRGFIKNEFIHGQVPRTATQRISHQALDKVGGDTERGWRQKGKDDRDLLLVCWGEFVSVYSIHIEIKQREARMHQ